MRENYKRFLAMVLFAAAGAFFCGAQEREASGVDRYAIYVGSNNGGKEHQRLMYAGTDAIAFQKTMKEIGGIPQANAILLLDPSKDDLDEALESVSDLIRRKSERSKRSEFLFYYSGHSDENALLLGNATYDYSGLKAAISSVPSDVHVVILDSCYSGNFIRTKGGQKKKPFLLDDSAVVKGHAYLSSSSSQEFSQESDEIGSSFFTNAMITGLRGAADSSGDKKVTLNELYSYAFNETLSKTENTSAGPQHPNYNITLVGSGDLVLSDISNSDCVVALSNDLNGRVIIRTKNGKLISEINKTGGKPVFLALEEGDYNATLITETMTMQGSFSLNSGKVYELTPGTLHPVSGTFNRVRGGDVSEEAKTEQKADVQKAQDIDYEDDEEPGVRYFPIEFSFASNEISRGFGKPVKTNFSIGIIRSQVYKTNGIMLAGITNGAEILNGAQAAAIFNINGITHGVQMAGIFNKTLGDMHGCQEAGIFNMAQEVRGVQAAGIFNKAEAVTGVQAAGIFNKASDITGLQAAGIGNFSNHLSNHAVQFAGIFNGTNKSETTQVAGICNYAGEIAKCGFQIGLINIAGESEGFQIGLVNYSKNGLFEFETSYTSNNSLRVVLNSGNKHLYSILGIKKDIDQLFIFKNWNESTTNYIFGLGSRVSAKNFNFDFEVTANTVFYYNYKDGKKEQETGFYPAFRFCAGYMPVKHFSVFGGINLMLRFKGTESAFDHINAYLYLKDDTNGNNRIYPEFDMGVRLSIN